MRGMLTREIRSLSKSLFGYEISVEELRLLPYVQYELMNSGRLDPSKINEKERKILSQWRRHGFLEGGLGEMTITKNFWQSMNEILWLGYVNYGKPHAK